MFVSHALPPNTRRVGIRCGWFAGGKAYRARGAFGARESRGMWGTWAAGGAHWASGVGRML